MSHTSIPTRPFNPLLGSVLMVGAMCLVPLMDGIAKGLSADYSVAQITWARYCFHLLILLPITLRYYGPRGLLPDRLPLQIIRGLFLLGSTALFFGAIAQMPVPDALALVFVAPFIITALSGLLLKEPVGPRRWTAVICGFLGALLIIRPGFGVFTWSSLLALGAGSCYALYILTTRKLAVGGASPLLMLTFTGIVGAVIMSCIVPFSWKTPGGIDLAWMVGLGAIAASGHFLLVKALQYASAAQLAPLTYSEIVMSTIVGYVGFGDFPDAWTWLGISVIIGSAVYISVRERRSVRKRR